MLGANKCTPVILFQYLSNLHFLISFSRLGHSLTHLLTQSISPALTTHSRTPSCTHSRSRSHTWQFHLHLSSHLSPHLCFNVFIGNAYHTRPPHRFSLKFLSLPALISFSPHICAVQTRAQLVLSTHVLHLLQF